MAAEDAVQAPATAEPRDAWITTRKAKAEGPIAYFQVQRLLERFPMLKLFGTGANSVAYFVCLTGRFAFKPCGERWRAAWKSATFSMSVRRTKVTPWYARTAGNRRSIN